MRYVAQLVREKEKAEARAAERAETISRLTAENERLKSPPFVSTQYLADQQKRIAKLEQQLEQYRLDAARYPVAQGESLAELERCRAENAALAKLADDALAMCMVWKNTSRIDEALERRDAFMSEAVHHKALRAGQQKEPPTDDVEEGPLSESEPYRNERGSRGL